MRWGLETENELLYNEAQQSHPEKIYNLMRGFNEGRVSILSRMADELRDTEQRRSRKKRCKELKHLLSVTTVLPTATRAASVPQEKPCFRSQSTPSSSPFPTNPSLLSLSSSRFPSNKHTGSVHYYSPGFTWTRIIALLSTTVSGEAGEREWRGNARDVL